MKRQKYNKNKQVLFYYNSFRINVPKVWMHCKIEDLRQEADDDKSIADYDSDFEWWFYFTFLQPPLSVDSSFSSSSSVWSSGQDDTDDFDE